jgi:transcriptional regulator with XRE-family HTH domain
LLIFSFSLISIPDNEIKIKYYIQNTTKKEKIIDKSPGIYYYSRMKKKDKKMKKTNVFVGDWGIRFLLFRKAIKRDQHQLASELKTNQEEIAAIEKNAIYPKINYLHFLNRKYGLNINWLLCNAGDMFVKDPPPDIDTNYAMEPSASLPPGKNKKIAELMRLMQIPSVEKIILAKLEEIKEQLRE